MDLVVNIRERPTAFLVMRLFSLLNGISHSPLESAGSQLPIMRR